MYQIKLSPYHEIFYNEWKLESKSYKYNIVFDQTLSSNLDVLKLDTAFKSFVSEHVLFNSHITEINNQPWWVPNTTINGLEFFSSYTDNDVFTYVANPFLIDKDPLYRYAIFLNLDNTYRLVVVLHHLLIDGLSIDRFVTEVSKYYNSYYHTHLGTKEQIASISSSVNQLHKNIQDNQHDYATFWNNILTDIEGIDLRFLNLISSPNSNFYKPIEYKFSFTADVVESLKNITKQYKITPYVYNQCVFAMLLSRYANQEKFVVSYPTAIVKTADFIFGVRVNTSLVVYKINPNYTVLNLVEQIKSFISAFRKNNKRYTDFPINQITKTIGNKSLLDVMFAQTNLRTKPFEFNNVDVININNEFSLDIPTKFAFVYEISSKNSMDYNVRCNAVSVDQTVLQQFINHFQRLFLAILKDLQNNIINKKLSNYLSLTNEEYYQVIYNWNQTYAKYPNNITIHKLFEEQVLKTPHNIAISHKKTRFTYNELNIIANQLSSYISSIYQLHPDDLVLIYLPRDEQFIISVLAVLKCGAAYVPLSLNHPIHRVKAVVENSRAKMLLTNSILIKNITIETNENSLINYKVVNVDNSEIKIMLPLCSSNNPMSNTLANNLAYVIYTSGTTGVPKGVMVEHKSIVNYVFYLIKEHHIQNTTVGSQYADFAFDASMIEVYPILLSGGTLAILPEEDKLDPLKINNFFLANNVEYAFLPPQIAQMIFNLNNRSLKVLIVGGDRFHNFKNQSYKVVNAYGLTETTVQSNGFVVDNNHYGSIPIGKPIANTTNYILDNSLQPLPIGAVGELYIGGVGVARGYLNNPQLTSERFIRNPFCQEKNNYGFQNDKLYKTGDLVRYLPDGNLEYIGRNDLQVKIRGYRIELGEIEAILHTIPEIDQVVVIPIESKTDLNMSYLVNTVQLKINYNKIEETKQNTGNYRMPPREPSKLLPIQEWFFAQNFFNINHWNQSFLIKTPQLNKATLKNSIIKLIAVHDNLRIKYKQTTCNSKLMYEPVSQDKYSNHLVCIDLMELDVRSIPYMEGTQEFRETFLNILTSWQSNFNIKTGQLYKFGYIYGYADGSARIYCALHHIIVDVVSWHIILYDLHKFYLENSKIAISTNMLEKIDTYPQLNKKYTSYNEWINLINLYPLSHIEEKSYWIALLSEYDHFDTFIRKLNIENSRTDNKQAKVKHLPFIFNLDVEHTKYLITENQLCYKANEILLAITAVTLRELFIHMFPTDECIPSDVYITLEGHGRENISPNIDTSHTIGWFTAMFPIKLKVGNKNLIQTLEEVKFSLHDIPNRGIGYGALFGYTEKLPDIAFNYLGQIDNGQADDYWVITNEDSGLNISYANKPHNLIGINIYISNAQLFVTITGQLNLAKLELFTELFKTNINNFINIIREKPIAQQLIHSNNHAPHHSEDKNFINTKTLVAYYVSDNKLESTKLKTYLSKHLPQYSIPQIFVHLDKIPLTTSGKIDIKSLPMPQLSDNCSYVKSRNEKEQLICDAFAKTLGVKNPSINDDFFVCGGDSILAIKLVMQLQNYFDVNIQDIYVHTTPFKLAQNLSFSNTSIKNRLLDILHKYEQPSPPKQYNERLVTKYLNNYLNKASSLVSDISVKKIRNVLLTGSTGYLGCNILYQLINYTTYNIYLFIRSSRDMTTLERINYKYKLYFNTILDKKIINNRVFVIHANLEKEDFGLSRDIFYKLVNDIDCVIHSAASVKQFGKMDESYVSNVKTTINLLEFTKLTKLKEFHHISTISVLNHNLEYSEKYGEFYTEDHQPDSLKPFANNVYLKTKLEAEKQVVAYRKDGINSNIYRIGTLAFMLKNLTAQENVTDTMFFYWLKFLLRTNYIFPEAVINLSPVDLTAEAIVKLFDKKCTYCQIYHVFNPHLFMLTDYLNMRTAIPAKIVAMPEFIKYVIEELNDVSKSDLIFNFLLAQGWMGIDGMDQFAQKIYLQNRTQNILESLKFRWPVITKDQFKKFVEHIF